MIATTLEVLLLQYVSFLPLTGRVVLFNAISSVVEFKGDSFPSLPLLPIVNVENELRWVFYRTKDLQQDGKI